MSYSSTGSVATLWTPSSYPSASKMPVPSSTRRYGSTTASSSLYRSNYSSGISSYTGRSFTEYRSRYTTPIRSTTVPATYQRSIIESRTDSNTKTISRDRSEPREMSRDGSYGRTTSSSDIINNIESKYAFKNDNLKLRNDRYLNSSNLPSSVTTSSTRKYGLETLNKYSNTTSSTSRPPKSISSSKYEPEKKSNGVGRKDKEDRDNNSSPSPNRTTERKNSSGLSSGLLSSPLIDIPKRVESREHSYSTKARGGLRGLRNLGNTCFMNSVIQCLSNTPPLREYLLSSCCFDDINTSSKMRGNLIKAFSQLLQQIWTDNSTSLSPSEFKEKMETLQERYAGYAQQDAQEFLGHLVEGLHLDVNRVKTKAPSLPDIDDSLSDNLYAMEMWKRYLRSEDSKIVDLFVGQLKSTLKCMTCSHTSVTFDPMWDLSLPVPNKSSSSLRLQSCFDSFTKEEILDGDEMATCGRCKTRRKSTKSFSIQRFPKVLVLHLKRFSPSIGDRYRKKLSILVEFPLKELNLSAYAANKSQSCTYDLVAVSNHSGSLFSGHYTAYCKNSATGQWHQFNDSSVSPISERNVVSAEAYLLFYVLNDRI